MKSVIVVKNEEDQTAVSAEGELLDILAELVKGIRRGEICVAAYDRALVKLIEAERVVVAPVAEVSG